MTLFAGPKRADASFFIEGKLGLPREESTYEKQVQRDHPKLRIPLDGFDHCLQERKFLTQFL